MSTPASAGGLKFIGVVTPLYRHWLVPATVAGRRSAFVAWTVMMVLPDVVLAAALQGHPHAAVVLRGVVGGDVTPVAFKLGKIPPGARSITVDLHNGSSVQTFAVVADGGVFANVASIGLLLGGAAMSVLLAMLLFVLGTGRARALRLVGVKTGQLSFQAMHDALTGLPNRALLIDRAEQMLARARRQRSQVAALFIDLDWFSRSTTRLVMPLVTRCFRPWRLGSRVWSATATRLVARAATSSWRCWSATSSMPAPNSWPSVCWMCFASRSSSPQLRTERSRSRRASASPWATASGEELLRDADLALYQAKQAGKDRYVLFENSMQLRAADRRALEIDLGQALIDEQLFLLYQPTFDLETQLVTGVEALIRWRHPTRGIVAPDEFIPLAEETAMIVPIGRWVLHAACTQAADWAAAGHTIGMSVNVSARQLEHDEFVDDVRDALQDTGLDPELLTLDFAAQPRAGRSPGERVRAAPTRSNPVGRAR